MLCYLNSARRVLQRIDVSEMSRSDINSMLAARGFRKEADAQQQGAERSYGVPDEAPKPIVDEAAESGRVDL
ncbi:hypothetical protein BOX15_Mlig024522g2 [Macrostomum lignano]|uniref:Selenoprotein F/M domain-containing protein n=1 Tax=Macrostomum lignano TaxID=282301 RepID=A0A267FSX0_9PLAT|nr:hypothetical protein BOX15_Mlig024522g1 [Macrostomum lignano]PAA76052.1 hypothetical protein BOX15_Mlig024522g2 [Macrostomum lignano]